MENTTKNAPYEAKLERTALALERIAIALEKLTEIKSAGAPAARNKKGGSQPAATESVVVKFTVKEIGQTWKNGGGYFLTAQEAESLRKLKIGVRSSINLQVGDVVEAKLERRGKEGAEIYFIGELLTCETAPAASNGAQDAPQEIEEDVPF